MNVSTQARLTEEVDHFLSARPGGERLLLWITLPSLLIGGFYGANRPADAPFIFLLCAATIFIAVRVLYIRRQLCKSASLLFGSVLAPQIGAPSPSLVRAWQYGASGPADLLRVIFHRGAMASCGVAYGAVLALSPLILGIYSTIPELQLWLMAFMFSANAVTGALFYSMIMLLRQSWHLAKRLDVSFFARRSAAVKNYTLLLASVSVSGALYIGLCQASVIFSPFYGAWIYGYAVFALFVFLAIYYVPQIPIKRRLAQERERILGKLDHARTVLFAGPISPESIDQLSKIDELESRIQAASIGLSTTEARLVKITAVGAALIPYLAKIIKTALPEYIEIFVRSYLS